VRGAAELPPIHDLPLPDVTSFVDAYERVVALAEDEVAVPLDLVADVRAAASDVERQLSDFLYALGRGYEAVLGPRRVRHQVERLCDESVPALAETPPAVVATDLPRLVAGTWALADGSVAWSPPSDSAPPAPGEVGAWLDHLGVPRGLELIHMHMRLEEVDA
jgi:hypothetical protein